VTSTKAIAKKKRSLNYVNHLKTERESEREREKEEKVGG
jgi:hypothetical protein